LGLKLKKFTTYLLDAVLVALLESKDFIGALLGVVDLLPSLHLLLLEERDTVCEQLSVALDASIKVNNF
jgi:hypothetical protein